MVLFFPFLSAVTGLTQHDFAKGWLVVGFESIRISDDPPREEFFGLFSEGFLNLKFADTMMQDLPCYLSSFCLQDYQSVIVDFEKYSFTYVISSCLGQSITPEARAKFETAESLCLKIWAYNNCLLLLIITDKP